MVDSAGRGGLIGELSRGIVLLVVVVVVVVVLHSAQSRSDRIEGKNSLPFSLVRVIVLVATWDTLVAR